MNINYNDLYRNCLYVVEKEGYYKAERLSDKQKKAFKEKCERLSIETEYTSGVKIEFYSTTSSVEFDFKTDFCSQTYANFDVFINDEFEKSVSFENSDYSNYHFEFSTEVLGDKKISIYLPHSTSVMIKDFKIDEGSTIKNSEIKDKTILCFGDSITQGYRSIHPKNTYPMLLSKKLDMNLINQGVSGYVHDYKIFDEDNDIKVDIVTSAFGTNDWDKIDDIEEIKENIRLYFSKLNSLFFDIPVFIITPIWRGSYLNINKSGTFYDVISIIIKETEKYNNFNLIDGFELVPHNPTFFDENTLHPNEECFKIYADNLYNKIIEIL